MKKGKKIAAFALSILALATFAVPALSNEPFFGASAQTIADFDVTKIEDDLQDIDENEYPADEDGETKVIRFQEYCYSLYAENSAEYGLYLYVYNPTEKVINTTENTVNMAVAYNKNGEPSAYENIPLTLLDKTDNNRFIKFKVTDASSFLKRVNAYAALHNGERRYDVADVNLFFADGSPAEATNASKTYVWTGFGVGMNNNAESSLACNVESLETLTLDVKHTYFRDNSKQENVSSTDTVHSVYFSVPNEVLDAYGALYRIHAEYLSARLKPALVLGDKEVYTEVSKYLWRDTSTHIEALDYQIASNYFREIDDNILTDIHLTLGDFSVATRFVYNFRQSNFWVGDGFADYWNKLWVVRPDYAKTLYMLFGTDTFAENSADTYTLSSKKLQQAMLNTSKNPNSTGIIVGADGEYSKDIFSHVDDKKTDLVLTADDTFDLTKTIHKRNFWGVASTEIEKVFSNQPVIRAITQSDFQQEDVLTAWNLMVAEEDLPELKQAYINATAKNETLFLFRYRVSDYVSYEAAILQEIDPWLQSEAFEVVSTNGYFFEQDVDLLFDIIDVMFLANDGTETVLGVVAKPIDNIPGATPAPDVTTDKQSFWEWLKENYKWIILGVVGYLLLCCLGKALYPTCVFILAAFPAIWWLITLPFRFIIWLIRLIIDKIKERRERRRGAK